MSYFNFYKVSQTPEEKYMQHDVDRFLEVWNKNPYLETMHAAAEKDCMPDIKRVIFNPPATIILWNNGKKTIVKSQYGEHYDPEKGMAMAIAKFYLGNKGNYYDIFTEWLPGDAPVPEPKAKSVDISEENMTPAKTRNTNNVGDGYDDIKWAEKTHRS